MVNPTTNPVPSRDPQDLLFNAETLDRYVNSSEQTTPSRFGQPKTTLAGFAAISEHLLQQIQAAGDAAVRSIGRHPPVAYSAGISMTSLLQTVEYGDHVYAPLPSALPFVTSGTFESTKFQLAQGVAGADLAMREGLPLLGYTAVEAQSILDHALPLVDVADLRAYTGAARRILLTGVMGRAKPDPRGGPVERVPGDTTTPDNDVDVYVDALGRRWKRPHGGTVQVGWAGAVGDGIAEDWAAIKKALDTNFNVEGDAGCTYKVSDTLTVKVRIQSLNMRGGLIDAYSLPEGKALFDYDSTRADSLPSDYQPAQVYGLHNIRLIGPGKAGSGASYASTTIGVQAHAPHTRQTGVNIYGFGVGVSLFSTSYVQTWDGCAIAQNGIGVHLKPGGSDYGERIVFSNSVIYDNALGIKNECPTGVLQFTSTSIDYNLKTLEANNNSVTELHGSWIECNDAGAGKVVASLAGGSQFTMLGGRLQQNGTPGALAQDGFFSVDATSRASMRDVFGFNLKNSANTLCIGNGLVEISGTKSYPVSFLPGRISPLASNLLSDGGCELTTVADLWSVYTDPNPITNRLAGTYTSLATSTDAARSGSRCLRVRKTVGGGAGSFVLVVPITPGRRAAIDIWYSKPAAADSGATVFMSTGAALVSGVSSGGVPNILNSVSFDTFGLGGTNSAIPWTQYSTGMDRFIPSWATHFMLYFNADAFQGDFYLDDITIGAM